MWIDKVQILNELMKYMNITSKAEFARLLSISPQLLSKWFERNTFDVDKIVNSIPDINPSWLLTGEGNMLNSREPSIIPDIQYGKLIPFYDAEVAAGNGYDIDTPAYATQMIEIGTLLRESEEAIRVYGNSMVPNYPAGCVIGTKPHVDSFIEPGTVYVIETRGGRYIKRLYYSEDKTSYECHSDNTMLYEEGSRIGKPFYPDFEIPISEVIRLHKVIGVIKRNIL